MPSSSNNQQVLINAIKGVVYDCPRTSIIPPGDFRLPPSTDQCKNVPNAIQNGQSPAGVGTPPNTPRSTVSEIVTIGLMELDEISSVSHLPTPILSERRNLAIDMPDTYTRRDGTEDVRTEINESPQEQYQISSVGYTDGISKSQLSSNEWGPTGPKGESMEVPPASDTSIPQSVSTDNNFRFEVSSQKIACPLARTISSRPGALYPTPGESSQDLLSVDNLQKELKIMDISRVNPVWDATVIDSGSSNTLRQFPKAKLIRVKEIWDDYDSRYRVVEWIEPERDNLAEYAIVVRTHVDRTSKQSTTYIDVKSEALRGTLAGVLKNAVNVKAPIRETALYLFLPDLERKLKEMSNNTIPTTSYHHLDLLISHLQKEYSSTADTLRPLLDCGEITYEHLVMLFKPGCKVYSKCFGTDEARCVVFVDSEERTRNDKTYFTIKCHYLDHDGEQFGEVDIELGIAKFSGCKKIHTLEAFPLQCHPEHDSIVQSLLERGRKFVTLSENRPLQRCKGKAFTMINRNLIKMHIDSRVAVDSCFFRKMEPNYRRPDTFEWEAGKYWREEARLRRNNKTESSLTDDDLLTCCPTVRCYSFNDREFLECAVSDLEDVCWSSAAFDSLQMPDERKEDLESVVTQHRSKLTGFDDLIPGKGKGCIILFSGSPGVGKTFSVESLAEKMKTPLFSFSIGDLGASHGDPGQLKLTLDRNFRIAEHFNAIILLNEADVFIEARSSYHDNHNHIVGVFLEILEYFRGILFMTTNLETGFDKGIMSRVYLQISFPALTKDARQHILETFVSKIPNASISNQDLAWLASMELDGRELKNLVSIACSLAESKRKPVTFATLKRALKLNDKFSERSTNRLDAIYT